MSFPLAGWAMMDIGHGNGIAATVNQSFI